MADGGLSSSVYYPPDPCPPPVKYMLSEVSEACANLVNITTPFTPNIPRENRCDCLGSHDFSIQDDCVLQRSDYYSILTDIEYCATKPSQYPSLAPIPTVSPSPSPSAIIPRVFGNSTTNMALRFPDSSPDSITNYILIFGFILICAAGSVYMAFAKKEVAKKDDSSGSKKSKAVKAAAEKATATDNSEGEPDEEEEEENQDIELGSRIDSDSESLPVQSPRNQSKKSTRSRREKKKKKHDKRKKKKVRQKASKKKLERQRTHTKLGRKNSTSRKFDQGEPSRLSSPSSGGSSHKASIIAQLKEEVESLKRKANANEERSRDSDIATIEQLRQEVDKLKQMDAYRDLESVPFSKVGVTQTMSHAPSLQSHTPRRKTTGFTALKRSQTTANVFVKNNTISSPKYSKTTSQSSISSPRVRSLERRRTKRKRRLRSKSRSKARLMDMADAQVDDNSSVSLVSISRMKSDEDHVDSSGSTITLRKESLHDLVSKELLNRAAEVQEIIDRKTKKGRKHAVKNGDKQMRRTKTRTRVEYRDNGGTVGKQRSRSDSPPILAILNTISHEDANPTLEKHISKKIRKHDYNELGLYE